MFVILGSFLKYEIYCGLFFFLSTCSLLHVLFFCLFFTCTFEFAILYSFLNEEFSSCISYRLGES